MPKPDILPDANVGFWQKITKRAHPMKMGASFVFATDFSWANVRCVSGSAIIFRKANDTQMTMKENANHAVGDTFPIQRTDEHLPEQDQCRVFAMADVRHGVYVFGSSAHIQDESVFLECDVLTPEMRAAFEHFIDDVDTDIFDCEKRAHEDLCRTLAQTAHGRGDDVRALKIERHAKIWKREHEMAYRAVVRKEVRV